MRRVTSAAAVVLVTTVLTTFGGEVAGAQSEPTAPGGFVAMAPSRLLDTRDGGQGPCISGGSARSLVVAGTAGIPTNASAVALNVTAVRSNASTHLTVYPAGSALPATSTVNFPAGGVVANAATVKPGTGGRVLIQPAAGCTHVVVDAVGYHLGGSPTGRGGLVGINPVRAYDSREDWWGCVAANTTREVGVTGFGGIPASASAVALNVTVTQPTGAGHLTVFPAGQARPTASNLNFVSRQTVANSVTSKVSMDGGHGFIEILNSSGCSHIVVDVTGYYTGNIPLSSGGIEGIQPSRLLDTRQAGQGPCLAGGAHRTLQVTRRGVVPSTATAVVLNVTSVRSSTGGHLTVYPTGLAAPLASNLNFDKGRTVPNAVTVGLGTGGRINLTGSAACTDVVVDVVGYYSGIASPASQSVVWKDTHRAVGIGTDSFAVWSCQQPGTPPPPNVTSSANWLRTNVAPLLSTMSGGLYTATFTARTPTISASDEVGCLTEAMARTGAPYSNVLVIGSDPAAGFGFAGPGSIWSNGRGATLAEPPSVTRRGGYLGAPTVSTRPNPGLIAHEVGHSLHWPHSYSGQLDEYDNPLDLMSGWTEDSLCSAGGGSWYTCKGQHTLAFNRLASGWIDDGDAVVHRSGTRTVDLAAPTAAGTQLILAPSSSSDEALITIEARPKVGLDAILGRGGVAVHLVDQRSAQCGLAACGSLYRRQGQAWGVASYGGYFAAGYDHVLTPGQSRTIHGLTVSVTSAVGSGYRVTLSGSANIPGSPFALRSEGAVTSHRSTFDDGAATPRTDVGPDPAIAPLSTPHGDVVVRR